MSSRHACLPEANERRARILRCTTCYGIMKPALPRTTTDSASPCGRALMTAWRLDGCAETLAWRALKGGPGAPPPAAEATLTSCGEHGLLYFGGHTGAASASAAVHVLQGGSGRWEALEVLGEAPAPRGHHTAVWDGHDSLIVFGGAAAGGCALVAAEVHVLSLTRRKWWRPHLPPTGPREGGRGSTGPGPRAQHCAAMLAPGRTMTVFGGLSSQVLPTPARCLAPAQKILHHVD